MDGYLAAKPLVQSGLRQVYFTSSGSWVCPEGVSNVIVIGCGGGQGGQGATDRSFGDGAGGGGAPQPGNQFGYGGNNFVGGATVLTNQIVACGGMGGVGAYTNGNSGANNFIAIYTGGSGGIANTGSGGGGGAAGSGGNGANGGDGNYPGNGFNGSNAPANSGAGGGAGGGGFGATGGNGGQGGSGYLRLIF